MRVPVGLCVPWPVADPIPTGWERATDMNGQFTTSPDTTPAPVTDSPPWSAQYIIIRRVA